MAQDRSRNDRTDSQHDRRVGAGSSAQTGSQHAPSANAEGACAHADNPAQVDRRTGLDRRAFAKDATGDTGLERRRGPGRRRTDFNKSAEEGEMTGEQFLFVMAIEAFKKANDKMYPTWTDVLEVVRLLGYRKTQASQLQIRNADDWTEGADAPTNVRSKPGHPEMGGGETDTRRAA